MYQEQRKIFIPKFFCLSVLKEKLEKSWIYDIMILGITSLTIANNRKAHIPFFESSSIFFLCMGPLPTLPFSIIQTNPIFQGLTPALGSSAYAHPARTGGKFCAGFRPSSSTPPPPPAFHIRYSSMRMLENNDILELFIPTFVMMFFFHIMYL